ncbi:MAG: hypothetical protein Q9227_006963 [Pyrenula ochraceoflavens]
MFNSLSFVSLFFFVSGAFSSPVKTRSEYAVKETHNVPRQWAKVFRAPATHVIDLKIALKQSNFDELERQLYAVSDPSHPKYGQHLRIDEVNELVKPTDETSELVHEWLQDNGISRDSCSYSGAKDWISVSLPVSEVERLLDTKYHVYRHDDGMQLVRTPAWSLPIHLHDHINAIQPTNAFMRGEKQARGAVKHQNIGRSTHMKIADAAPYAAPDASVAAVCNTSSVTPLCLRTFYQTLNYTVQAADKNSVGLTDYLGESNNRSDTYRFLSQYRPEAVQAAYQFKVEQIAGGPDEQTQETPEELAAGTSIEGNLDVETILSESYPTPLTAYSTGGSPPFINSTSTPTNTNEPYLVWVERVLSDASAPNVISTSYGDDEQTVPLSYATTVCNKFAELGARGKTLMFSSGDSGVGPTGACVSNDGKNTTKFLPSFPSSCPFITTVGATQNFTPECAAYNPRNRFASGSGFSNYFTRPDYQSEVVPAYIDGLDGLYDGLYNKTGRAYPDISAQGRAFAIVWNGTNLQVDGTSASTPLAASIITLVNDARIAANKKPLGWLNPWLYTQGGGEAFTDITCGSAIGCGVAGFPAKEGWDPVTGFGTPGDPLTGIFLLELPLRPSRRHEGPVGTPARHSGAVQHCRRTRG